LVNLLNKLITGLTWSPWVSDGPSHLVSKAACWSPLVSMGLCLVYIVPAWSLGISLCVAIRM